MLAGPRSRHRALAGRDNRDPPRSLRGCGCASSLSAETSTTSKPAAPGTFAPAVRASPALAGAVECLRAPSIRSGRWPGSGEQPGGFAGFVARWSASRARLRPLQFAGASGATRPGGREGVGSLCRRDSGAWAPGRGGRGPPCLPAYHRMRLVLCACTPGSRAVSFSAIVSRGAGVLGRLSVSRVLAAAPLGGRTPPSAGGDWSHAQPRARRKAS